MQEERSVNQPQNLDLNVTFPVLQGFRGTVKDFSGFNANGDAEALYNAMKGFGEEPYLILIRILRV